MNEKMFTSLGRLGGAGIAMGIVVLVTGVTVGILGIINGARVLHWKKKIMI